MNSEPAPDGMLLPEEAREWLRSRRGFVPTKLGAVVRKDKALFWSDQAFRQYGLAEGLRRLIWDWKEATPELVGVAAGVSKDFMAALMSGRPLLNIEALKRVGKALDVDVPQFVGFAVQEALKAKVNPNQAGAVPAQEPQEAPSLWIGVGSGRRSAR